MARLNEPPVAPPGPSTETVEVVKRRYLRQNRELAKINSQQSVRIRNLETEGSRLLAENLSLREQVLQLQNAHDAQSSLPSFEAINSVKSQLEAKLLEVGNLVAGLSQLQGASAGPKSKSEPTATRRGPDERQWRSGLGLQAVENAMLPTIMEDKYYPRRTMNAEELRHILDDADSQSPDLGPPPVSQFEHEDPISFNPSGSSEEQPEEPVNDPEPPLSINLETRRKRRESGPKSDMRRVSIFEPPSDEADERPNKARTGSKRKFTVQEDEDKGAESQVAPFSFTRRNGPNTGDEGVPSTEMRPRSPERLILSSKPVNTDPVVSPKKQRSSVSEKPEKPVKKPTSKSTRGRLTITRPAQAELPPLRLPDIPPTAEINLEALPPKTPAVEAIFSPPSTQPSNSRPQTNDTPPPGDLNASDQTGGARPSRRARPQVSYKEPSLNTKMRRPGKELVDAVQPTNDRRSSVDPTQDTEMTNSAWKALALVSGREGPEMEVGSPLREKLGRRENSNSAGDAGAPEQLKLNSSAASSAISALISATSNAKRKASLSSTNPTPTMNETPDEAEPTAKAPAQTSSSTLINLKVPKIRETATKEPKEKDSLAIFDFSADALPDDPPLTHMKLARGSRRHSSVPTSSSTEERKADPRASSLKPDAALPSLHMRSGSASGIKSSSTSNLVMKSSATSAASSKALPSVRDRKRPTTSSSDATKVSPVESSAAGTATSNLRAERAASRRKSMMM